MAPATIARACLCRRCLRAGELARRSSRRRFMSFLMEVDVCEIRASRQAAILASSHH